MFGRLGPLELVIILVIVLIILGPQRLSGVGKALGKTIREFRSTSKSDDEEEPKAEKGASK